MRRSRSSTERLTAFAAALLFTLYLASVLLGKYAGRSAANLVEFLLLLGSAACLVAAMLAAEAAQNDTTDSGGR